MSYYYAVSVDRSYDVLILCVCHGGRKTTEHFQRVRPVI